MITSLICVAFIAASCSVLVPSPHDAHGWGLRVERLTHGPYIVGETYKNVRVKMTLINKTAQERAHWPLAVAVKAGELRQDSADAMNENFARMKAENMRMGMDGPQAAAAALEDLKATTRAMARKRYNAVLNQINTARELGARFGHMVAGKLRVYSRGEVDPGSLF